jgi:CysZ protein
MLAAAVKALSQMGTPPFRTVLIKSVGLALVFLVALGIALARLFAWLLEIGATWTGALGSSYAGALAAVQWLLALVAGLGILAGLIFLVPAVTAMVASFFADEIAERVERVHYPADSPGRPLPVGRAMFEGGKTALLSLALYLCAVPFLLLAGVGIFIFFFATAWLLGREYFELAAMRHRLPRESKALRKQHQSTVFTGGMLIAAFVSVPILNLATPLFATALMVHVYKRLTKSRRAVAGSARLT